MDRMPIPNDFPFALALDAQRVNALLAALSKEPYNMVAALIQEIQNQCSLQYSRSLQKKENGQSDNIPQSVAGADPSDHDSDTAIRS